MNNNTITAQFNELSHLIDRAELSRSPYDFVDVRLALLALKEDVAAALKSGQPVQVEVDA
jgi:uncharacterized protein YdcH (DUF465 family)